jgi:hypothetical protein
MTFCHGEVNVPGVLPMWDVNRDEIWQHREKIHARPGQREWNKMEHQIVEEGYGNC